MVPLFVDRVDYTGSPSRWIFSIGKNGIENNSNAGKSSLHPYL